MPPILSVRNLEKTYDGGFQALKSVSLDIKEGEVFALLGPNGAGKTTLISTICGLVRPTSGSIQVGKFDAQKDFRAARSLIGLVPQEMPTAPFEIVGDTVALSRGLFGLPPDRKFLEGVLKDLTLWDKRKNMIMALSGGMKRRLLVAKALAHEPKILFLDEPTAGVDVELRHDMWRIVGELKERGVTIILTTHYIEEAEEMADRVGVIDKGEIILVEEKAELMRKLGRKLLKLNLADPLTSVPDSLSHYNLTLEDNGTHLIYTYDTHAERTGITALLTDLAEAGVRFQDLQTDQSSLEDIFVDLVKRG
ncbi:ABC-2 type transport system ATP-binding protein [Labrenzia sp. EL_208]|uniref:Daunorubicin/doxorubicin resistance ATP-binding protein DrrA n=1 Tax=Roseibium album TaxID=311410 RepID=A0A0M6ZC05_9HYPH|nr:ABC transporter ATP-binding protein [Roseibium album]MBG6173125.1 ABC-2 type transport system ATP-binding protein [Labrenzia sp. EL_132]MBG6210411.1 ABC-2 type transport system ATP-binding protein [Labrenzia sp. EL_126]MBG6228105.1 ABC-2 type transport system ATP-binding protein [Labrenzia sp. EL_208]CTQ59676.1 Daunorubicin/doxorubicin resistance ATP-binding protein DrrA [Roseibium album]CTQ75967.1 Daunorubicin/doxorubicin resistance ATP-binding protein DrrA [Roseibium album]